jgi:hypothetical protein
MQWIHNTSHDKLCGLVQYFFLVLSLFLEKGEAEHNGIDI